LLSTAFPGESDKSTQQLERQAMNAIDWLHTFTRSRQDRWIGGVCGGLGKHSPIPSWTWRLLFTLSVLIWGTGLLVYILLWIFVPEEPESKDVQPAA